MSCLNMTVWLDEAIVPGSMRTDILQKLHDGHQGLTKCRERANAAVWWPGLATKLKTL